MASSSESLTLLRELFPDWSDEDLSICLEESRGELDTAITRISEGHATKFGEVTKKKDKAPRRVEYGNGRGRGRGASTGAPRGRSEFRGRGRGRGVSTSVDGAGRAAATETSTPWPESTTTNEQATPAWATDDAADATTSKTAETGDVPGDATGSSDTAPSLAKSNQPAIQTTAGSSSAAKPKSRIIDKNSTSSWASIAKPPVQPSAAPVPQRAGSQKDIPKSTVPEVGVTDAPAPLTEENLEAATEDQENLPQPPAATVASLQGEPATGPSSVIGAPGTPSVGPPGLKSGGASGAGRVSTPVAGRRLNQNEAVVMPGSEREPSSRLGVQFGSLGISDDEVYSDRAETTNNNAAHQTSEDSQGRQDASASLARQEKPVENYGGYGGYGGQSHQQQQPGYNGQTHDQYGMSNFYGQNEPSRHSPFAGQADYYQQQTAHAQQLSQQAYGGTQSAASQRTDSTSRPEHSSRFGESSGPMGSMGSQPPHAGVSPAPSHLGGPQHSQFPMHPQQYGAPNPYAYYGYGYGYPQQQQQHSAYAPMYGQQQQQRGHYGGQGQYPGAPVSHQPVGTSQDRFERSTAEYQRQQQMSQYSQSGFGNTDFLGSSRNAQPSNEAVDPFKGYNSQGSTGSRDETKAAPAGYSSQSSGFGQQAPNASQYGGQAGAQYGGEQQQQQQQQSGQGQGQYSQYGSYGRAGAHQQYGGQWNQQY